MCLFIGGIMRINKTQLLKLLNMKHKSIYDLIFSGISQNTITAITMNNIIEFSDILKISFYLNVNYTDLASFL